MSADVKVRNPIADLGQGWQRSAVKSLHPFDIAKLPLNSVTMVTFFKRDEITTDLVCCEVVVRLPAERTFLFHEEMDGWEQLLVYFDQLPNFRSDWRASVVLPPFQENRMVAYRAQH